MTHIWILHCPAGGGHRAAAEALANQARSSGVSADVVDALSFTPSWFAASYVQTHLKSTRYAPWAYGFGYDRLNRRRPALDSMRRRVDGLIGRRLLEAVNWACPDAIIGTHFFPLAVLGRARKRGRLATPVVGVVTDFTAHAFWVEPGVDRYCVAAHQPRHDLASHGVRASNIFETGIPVRAAFGAIPPARYTADKLRVLITSGGFGIGPLESALLSFAGISNVELTVVCGADDERRAHVATLAQRAAINAEVVGFERNMPERFAAAHVVLGKPGGLTVSESLAAGRPMALMGTCPGQEAHNEAWLVEKGAAVIADPRSAGAQLSALHRSGRLARMAVSARHLGTPDAAANVLRVALPELAQDRAA